MVDMLQYRAVDFRGYDAADTGEKHPASTQTIRQILDSNGVGDEGACSPDRSKSEHELVGDAERSI